MHSSNAPIRSAPHTASTPGPTAAMPAGPVRMHHQPAEETNSTLVIPSQSTTPAEDATIKTQAQAITQLTTTMQQLQVQFGSIASSLALVVEQLAVLTTQQQHQHQQQQQQLPPPATRTPVDSISGPTVHPEPSNDNDHDDEDEEALALAEEGEDAFSSSEEAGDSSDSLDDEDQVQANLARQEQQEEMENEESETKGSTKREASVSRTSEVRHALQKAYAATTNATNKAHASSVLGSGTAVASAISSMQQLQQQRSASASPAAFPAAVPFFTAGLASATATAALATTPAANVSFHGSNVVSPSAPTRTISPSNTNAVLPLDAPEPSPLAQTHPRMTPPPRSYSSTFAAISPAARLAISSPRHGPTATSVSAAAAGPAATSTPHRGHSHSVSGFDSLAHTLHGQHIFLHHENKIKLNVGGQIFCTSVSTLLREPHSFFATLVSGRFNLTGEAMSSSSRQAKEAVFIDRDPRTFNHVLNYLRDGSICLEGMTSVQKRALVKEARYFGLSGLVALLQVDARLLKSAQRRELSSEKEYKLLEDVPAAEVSTVLKQMTMFEGYEVEAMLAAQTTTTKASSKRAGTTTLVTVHLLFSKKLSRGELMLLDRLQNHM